MPRHRPEQRPPRPGERVSLRRVRTDGEQGDLVGFVLSADTDGLLLRDRRGRVHNVTWQDVRALRVVGAARGRDPLSAERADLDRLAAASGVTGRAFVARLSSLLEGRSPAAPDAWDAPPPYPATVSGEWVTTGHACADPVPLAQWATQRDARSIQVRTDDADAIETLLRLGFAEMP